MADIMDIMKKAEKEKDVIILIQVSKQGQLNTYGRVFLTIKEQYSEWCFWL